VQVFGNLIGNASKYTPEGGRIDVVVRIEGESTVTSIKDTGIGLAADQLANVFGLFTQIDDPMACSKTGLGIGLPLARQLVDLHGGEIEACSEGLGHGSEFVVRLPTCVEAN
jgi:signal transduction histidine kinase